MRCAYEHIISVCLIGEMICYEIGDLFEKKKTFIKGVYYTLYNIQ